MLIKLNCNLLFYKKGSIIDLDKIIPKHKTYFNRRLQDAKIDNCVEIVKDKKEEIKEVIKESTKEIKKDNKIESKNTVINKETLKQ